MSNVNASEILNIVELKEFSKKKRKHYVIKDGEEEEKQNNRTSYLFSDKTVFSVKISTSDYLAKLYFLIQWSDHHGETWLGIHRFIDIYFSLIFYNFFGKHFKMNIIHVAKRQKLTAQFILHSEKKFTILIMMNYDLWDKILKAASALPDQYFKKSPRSKLTQELRGDAEALNIYNSEESLRKNNFTPLMDVSLAALCLINRLESAIQRDLDRYKIEHVVTLAKFFSNNPHAKDIFETTKIFE